MLCFDGARVFTGEEEQPVIKSTLKGVDGEAKTLSIDFESDKSMRIAVRMPHALKREDIEEYCFALAFNNGPFKRLPCGMFSSVGYADLQLIVPPKCLLDIRIVKRADVG